MDDTTTEAWTWPFTPEQQARLSTMPCSVDEMQDVFFYGPDAAICLGMLGPTWADGFVDSAPGDVWMISFRRMSLREIDALPEFGGF